MFSFGFSVRFRFGFSFVRILRQVCIDNFDNQFRASGRVAAPILEALSAAVDRDDAMNAELEDERFEPDTGYEEEQ